MSSQHNQILFGRPIKLSLHSNFTPISPRCSSNSLVSANQCAVYRHCCKSSQDERDTKMRVLKEITMLGELDIKIRRRPRDSSRRKRRGTRKQCRAFDVCNVKRSCNCKLDTCNMCKDARCVKFNAY